MSSILITGATGFVGLTVAEQLVSAGHKVTCVLRYGSEGKLRGLNTQLIFCNDLFEQTAEWWAQACCDIDMVIHLAWYAEPEKYLTSDKNIDCLIGTMNIARGAVKAGVARFVGVGTCFEYDLSAGRLTVNTPLNPQTPYAAAKMAAYSMLKAYLAEGATTFLWARLFYLFGPREDTRRLVPYLHTQLKNGVKADLSSGTKIRDYMDVRDAAKLLLNDAFSSRQGATNICSGQATTIRALAERIADQYNRRDLLNFNARPDNFKDPPKVLGSRDKFT
jgi:dTDP-6-deoxy-L-talose 4-dehydrogenase (NAD+)